MKKNIICCLCVLILNSSMAVDLGALDVTFSQDGITDGFDISGDMGYDREGSDIVYDSMNRLIIVGYYEYDLNGQQLLSGRIERRLADGSLDNSFDGDGYKELFLEPSDNYRRGFKVEMDENDGFFVAHTTKTCSNGIECHNDIIVYHFNSSGLQTGIHKVGFDRGSTHDRQNDNFSDMVYLPDVNRLALTASIELTNSDDNDYGVAMLLVNTSTGALSADTDFNTDGKNWCFFDHADPSGSWDLAKAIDWDPVSQHIIVGGSSYEGNGLNSDGWNMSFCEFDIQGNLITKWSTESMPDVFFDVEQLEDLVVTRINNQTHVIAAGSISGDGGNDFALVRYVNNQPGGWMLDTSFGSIGNGFESTGFEYLFIGATDDNIEELLIEDDGSIIAAGNMYWEDSAIPHRAVAIARYTKNGYLDTNWGIGHTGKAVHTFTPTRVFDQLQGVAINPETEDIYITGQSLIGQDFHSLVAKMHNDMIYGANFDF